MFKKKLLKSSKQTRKKKTCTKIGLSENWRKILWTDECKFAIKMNLDSEKKKIHVKTDLSRSLQEVWKN